jgi:hypothetical protein
MMHEDEEFRFAGSFFKASDATDTDRLVCGMASCEEPDAQDESVIQKGLDFSYLLSRGFINWDHREDPANLIGEPLEAEVVVAQEHPVLKKSKVQGLALWAKGRLFKGLKRAEDTWDWINALERSGSKRRPAWSIQGKVKERKGNRIVKSEVRHLALTHQPIQQLSFAEVVKSFGATGSDLLQKTLTTGAGAPLLLENLHGKLTRVLYGECDDQCYDRRGQFRKGIGGALDHLVSCHGESVDDAAHFLKTLAMSGITRARER